MKPKYVIHYTLFGLQYNRGFKSSYRFFETKEELDKFIKNHRLTDNYLVFEKINKGETQ